MFWAVADRDHQPAGTDPRHRAPTSYAQAPRTRPRHRRPDDAGHGADGLVAAHPAAPGPDDADAVGVDRGGAAAGLPPGAVVLGRDRARDADRVAVAGDPDLSAAVRPGRSEEHTSELQSLMRISYDVFCLKKKSSKNTEINN